MDTDVSRFGVVEPEQLPDDLRVRIGAITEKSGFVPNIFRALGHRPAELRAFLDYHDAVMERSDGLTKAERELVVVATSGANHCTYCVVAHGAILRVRSKEPELADRVSGNPWQVERVAAEPGVLPDGPHTAVADQAKEKPRGAARSGVRQHHGVMMSIDANRSGVTPCKSCVAAH
jgi:AhpD family alkylhydroperoxidase